MPGDWRKWILLIQLLILLLIYHSLPTLKLDDFHVLYPMMKREWKFIPSPVLNFLKPLSDSHLSFSSKNPELTCKKKDSPSAWDYGLPSFVDYINKVYIPLREQQFPYDTARVVYAKYGTPGIANQMKCACDTLLYALLTNRTFQSLCLGCV